MKEAAETRLKLLFMLFMLFMLLKFTMLFVLGKKFVVGGMGDDEDDDGTLSTWNIADDTNDDR